MRILTGRAKGQFVKRPRGSRLTSEKVKAALFNILGDHVRGARFLDVCAGSGSVGLEAWSLGAERVTWIERDPRCCAVIKENIANICRVPRPHDLQVLCADAPAAMRRLGHAGQQVDVIFVDAPYRDISLLKKTLQALERHAILRPTGWLVVEHERRLTLAQLLENMRVLHQYRYGDTVLSCCRSA